MKTIGKIIKWGFIAIFFVGFLAAIIPSTPSKPAQTEEKEEEPWPPKPHWSDDPVVPPSKQLDMHEAEYAIMYYMKTHLADPGSYSGKENVCYPAVWYQNQSCWVVVHTYRFKNQYGGMVFGKAKFFMNGAAKVVGAEDL